MLSPDGRCFTFDQRANGFVPGEGVGVVMLKRLADAERDGDHILRRDRGLGRQPGRQDQRHHRAQSRVADAPAAGGLRQVPASIRPSIQLIEAHGTGTKLGRSDRGGRPEGVVREVHADRSGYCALGSVKSNIGHCLTAAGVAGLHQAAAGAEAPAAAADHPLRAAQRAHRARRQPVLRQRPLARLGRSTAPTGVARPSARSASAAPMPTSCSRSICRLPK